MLEILEFLETSTIFSEIVKLSSISGNLYTFM